ncbi:MAG: putative addiction module antidote protein [Actinomycetes bacterium]|jgi:probable addiction module antidote protein|nr:putative addiction module antidote protein [Actinomycetes bacterium]
MIKANLTPYDTADYLKTEDDIAGYIDAVLAENDPALLIAALGDVARARGMSRIARQSGASREHLYRALSADGNPSAATLLKIVAALGVQLHASPMADDAPSREVVAA